MNKALEIVYLLLTSPEPLSTNEIVDRLGCDRKSVYNAIDRIELAGFCTEIIRGSSWEGGNRYLVRINA